MIDKQQAITLRQQGCTYNEIANTIGCSVDWCKRNLKEVKKNTNEADILTDCLHKATSKIGITNTEIQSIIRQHMLELKTYAQIEPIYKRMKRKIQQNKQAIIRPVWMIPDKAQQCFDSLLISVNNLDARIDDEVNMIRMELQLDKSYSKSIKYALFSLTQMGEAFTGRPIESVLSYIHSTIAKLNQDTPHCTINIQVPKSVFDLDDESVVLHLLDDNSVNEYTLPDYFPVLVQR